MTYFIGQLRPCMSFKEYENMVQCTFRTESYVQTFINCNM